MTKKQYTVCRLVIIILLSFSISVSITLNNYYLPVIFVITAISAMYYCKKQSKTILADERDYQIAGNAARYTISVYGFIGAFGTFVLMAISNKQGDLYVLSQYLAFSVCFLMLLYSFLFKYLNKKGKQ